MRVELLLDSGAYAGWRKGEEISIYDYIEYILRHEESIIGCVNLDMIPGTPGRTPTPEEVEDSARRSYDNLQIMKEYGLQPMPVFHQGESFHWLKRYLDDEEPIIAISPAADQMGWRGPNPEIWMDQVFNYLTDEDGYPIVKTHGMGVTGAVYLARYPWYSCDSTSWTQIANFGKIMVPLYHNGKPDYLSRPRYVHVSDFTERIPDSFVSAKDKSKDQFGNLGKLQQEQVIRFVTEECNLTMTEVRYCDNKRRQSMICFWSNVVKAIGDTPRFKYKRKQWSMRSEAVHAY